MSTFLCAAVDVGHSAVKAVWRTAPAGGKAEGEAFTFPTSVIPAFELSDEAERRRAEVDLVSVEGRDYFVGESAVVHGRGRSLLIDQWLDSPEHKALLRSALDRIERVAPDVEDRMLVLGLPARLVKSQRAQLEAVSRQVCPSYPVKILPQSKAPFHAFLQGPDGNVAPGRRLTEECWAVLDVGRYTVDSGASIQGRWSDAANSSDDGTKIAEDRLIELLAARGVRLSQSDAEQVIRQGGVLKYRGERLDVSAELHDALGLLQNRVVEYAARVFESLSARLDGVILAGGGAPLVREVVSAEWGNVHMDANPRMTIAEGMCRWGLGVMAARRQQPLAA